MPLRVVLLARRLSLGCSVRHGGLVLLHVTVARCGVWRDIGLLLKKRICSSHHFPHVVSLNCHDRFRRIIVVRVKIIVDIMVAALVDIKIRVEDLHHAVVRRVIQPVPVHIHILVYSFILPAARDLEIDDLLRFVLGQELGA